MQWPGGLLNYDDEIPIQGCTSVFIHAMMKSDESNEGGSEMAKTLQERIARVRWELKAATDSYTAQAEIAETVAAALNKMARGSSSQLVRGMADKHIEDARDLAREYEADARFQREELEQLKAAQAAGITTSIDFESARDRGRFVS